MNKKIPAFFVPITWMILLTFGSSALGADLNDVIVSPPSQAMAPDSIYFTPGQKQNVLVPVNMWGAIRTTGLHYVPVGASLLQTVSLAGGPSQDAITSSINIYHANGKKEEVNLYTDGMRKQMLPGDTVQVDLSTWKTNIPIILGGVSTLLGIATVLLLLFKPGG